MLRSATLDEPGRATVFGTPCAVEVAESAAGPVLCARPDPGLSWAFGDVFPQLPDLDGVFSLRSAALTEPVLVVGAGAPPDGVGLWDAWVARNGAPDGLGDGATLLGRLGGSARSGRQPAR